jgi:hypothetical protein
MRGFRCPTIHRAKICARRSTKRGQRGHERNQTRRVDRLALRLFPDAVDTPDTTLEQTQ